MLEGFDFVLVFVAAIAAGAINALAGGGTLITFPMLTAVGVPAAVGDQLRAVRGFRLRRRRLSRIRTARRYRGVRQQFVKLGEARGDQVAVVVGRRRRGRGRDLGCLQAAQRRRRGRQQQGAARQQPGPEPEDS